MGTPHTRPLLGVAYLAVIALLIGSNIQIYRKAMPWQDATMVTLNTSTPGLELNVLSDVKLQGVRVGEVRGISSDGQQATVELRLDSDKVDLIPANVDARIVPKTLFGEKIVDLVVPKRPSSARISDGAVIRQSTTSVEIGQLFSNLVPVLRTLRPEQLSAMLTSLATAVNGRGAKIAHTLNQLTEFLRRVDPHLTTFTHDLRQLARTADVYAESAPDLLRILSSTATISRELLIPEEQRLEDFLDGLIDTAGTATEVLEENAEHLVTLSGRVRPVLALLDEYSSMLPCLIDGLKVQDELANHAFGARGPFLNLTIDLITQRKPYLYPRDLPSSPTSDGNNANLPEHVPSWKPHCPQFAPRVRALGNAEPLSQLAPGQTLPGSGGQRRPVPNAPNAPNAPVAQAVDEARASLARVLAARMLGVSQEQVPPYAVLLLDPMLGDGEVRLP